MQTILFVQSAVSGILTINGQFCGPLDAEGQSFPAGQNAELYLQLFPFEPTVAPLTAAMTLSAGYVERLQPQANAYALQWPDGIVQVELLPPGASNAAQAEPERTPGNTLMRYLSLRLSGNADADALMMRPQDAPDLSAYEAVTPLQFGPLRAPERFDQRAGLVRRLTPNVAAVDAALAVTAPMGQGRRVIEQLSLLRT